MKKVIILLIVIFLSGCSVNNDLNRVCSYEIKSSSIVDKTTIDLIYDNDDVVKEAEVIKYYKVLNKDGVSTLANIKEANSYYNNKYSGKNVLVYISKDSDEEFEIRYKINVQKTDEEILEDFKLMKNSVSFFNRMKSEKIECEVK